MNIPNLKSTTYKDGERPTCPYCKSVQVKSMANQPKKFPEPKMYWHSNRKQIEALQHIWRNGYDCKKCGNEFIALKWEMRKSWEQNSSPYNSGKPQKKSGFFGKLLKWFFISIIALAAIGYFFGDDKPKTEEASKTQKTKVIDGAPQEDPSKQEFSKEAEEAAHAYIPQLDEKQPESIRGSNNQGDTLNIKTTVRESN